MRYLHTMIRVSDLEKSLDFYCNKLGLRETHRHDVPQGRFTLVFLAPEGQEDCAIELTYNWDFEVLTGGRNFGHLAYEVENIYETCENLLRKGVIINRPPRDGKMAFIRSPDEISIELLQRGIGLAPREPWVSMPNSGTW